MILCGCGHDAGSSGTAPLPQSVRPTTAVEGLQVPVTIAGRFAPVVKVSYVDDSSIDTAFTARLGGIGLLEVTYVDTETLTAEVPGTLACGTYDLAVADANGRTGTLADAFTVTPADCPRDADADGYVDLLCLGDDCDDSNAAIHPGAVDDDCDNVDDDCDGLFDEDYAATATQCGTGVCAQTGQLECQGAVEVDTCTPGSPLEEPEATCDDSLDNDCDGWTDANDSDCVTCVSTPPADWFDASWLARRTLTFDNSAQAGDLRDFPVLVVLEATWFDYAKTELDGSDLRFVDADATTELSYHIERWDPAGASHVWVRVPLIPAQSAVSSIWMYYQNPAAADAQDSAGTYDADTAGVWHLSEAVADEVDGGQHLEATANGNHGTQHGNAGAPGQIAGGQAVDGDDYVEVAHDASLNLTNAWTLEAWVNADLLSDGWQAVISKDCDADELGRAASLWLYQDKVEIWYTPNGTQYRSNQSIQTGTWTYLAATYNGTRVRLYIDGQLDGSATTPTPDTNSFSLYFGQRGNETADHWWFAGKLDEVRVSQTNRGGSWVAAQYLSMTDAFVAFGGEEEICP